jgi:hypothetical protein
MNFEHDPTPTPLAEPQPPRRRRRRGVRVAAAAVAISAFVVFGAADVAHAATPPTTSGKAGASAPSGGEEMPPGGKGGSGGPGGASGGGTIGVVKSVADGSFILSERGTSTVTVEESSSTVYLAGTTKASASALKKGDFVMVTGKKSTDGSITATKVTMGTAPKAGGMGAPGGGGATRPAG